MIIRFDQHLIQLRQPVIARAIGDLRGRISNADMRGFNASVDIERRDIKDVVREFLNWR